MERNKEYMKPQGESIWGSINLCIEIALNIYYLVGEHGEGIMIPKEHAIEHFSPETVAAGCEEDGCLYYPKGETMDKSMPELMREWEAYMEEQGEGDDYGEQDGYEQ